MSDYFSRAAALMQAIDIAFHNAFHLIQPYQATDYIPGDRYGILDFQSYQPDPDRPLLEKVRSGIELKVFRASMLLSIALDAEGKDDGSMQRLTNMVFASEAIEIEQRLAEMLQQLYDQGFAYELELDGTVDKGVSVVLRDRSTWLVNVTGEIVLRVGLSRAIDGTLVFPLNNNG